MRMWPGDKHADTVRATYARHGSTPEGRAKCNRVYLFLKSLTGRRLRAAFGDLCEEIIWEEASKDIGSKSSSSFKADPAHIADVIRHFQPGIVLVFGGIAGDGLARAMQHVEDGAAFQVVRGPHPAARHSTVVADLAAMAVKVRSSLQTPIWPGDPAQTGALSPIPSGS